ncbi:peptidoglycan D,D-transpeptidase FtsI family protein, partial [Patescibacteria group bacterium]
MRKKTKKKSENSRVNLLFIFYVSILAIFTLRLFSIQILNHGKYSALAQEQYWNLSVIPAQRGDIITIDNLVLAGTQTHYLMYAEPKKVGNTFETAHMLAEVVTEIDMQTVPEVVTNGVSVDVNGTEDVSETLNKDETFQKNYEIILANLNSDLFWVVIRRNISPVDKENIEAIGIKGIGFEEEPVRYYPEKELASHVLGFVAYNESGEKQGYFGIEGALNGDLKGKTGRILEEHDALGNPILIGDYKKSDPIKGRDIVLTINRAIQYTVEKKLKEGVLNYEAKSGSVIVMNPYTGDIVAMANYPSYEPNNFNYKEDNTEQDSALKHRKDFERINHSISQTYEPGSVLKPLTVSAAVELGKVNPNTTFEDNGPVQYSDYVIDNWDGKHHGTQTIVQLLEKSNNIGASWVGHLVGSKDLEYFFKQFGLGVKTDIELEGEDTGVIRDYKTWTDIDLATAAFGQGISATPLQVLNAFNVFANGGFLVQPRIVSKIIDNTETITMPTKQINRVLRKDTANTMVDMLVNAAESGEAKYFVLKNYNIAGKTGTAQIPVDGKYDPEKTNATFVGFLSNSKKFTMIVKLEEPQSSVYAAETAVPLWMDIADELVKYYGVP